MVSGFLSQSNRNIPQTKSLDQTFSKVCGFQRRRLWPLSAESGIFFRRKTQEGVKKQSGGLFLRGNPRMGFPHFYHALVIPFL